MKISKAGIELIKRHEGCRLNAYKPVATEEYWTIGYGHYGPDVSEGMTITQQQAEELLIKDLEKFEKKVEKYNAKYRWSQNEFDALVSFAFNIGSIDQLTAGGTRLRMVIAEKILLYNKAGEKVLNGLVKRRKEEQALFLSGSPKSNHIYYPKYAGTSKSIVVALQSLKIDGSFSNRKEIAKANGISNYSGTAEENILLLKLLKDGILKKA